MIVIYALIDPRTQQCRYVGKTSRLKQRLQDHTTIKGKTLRYRWAMELKHLSLSPEAVVLEDTTDKERWQEYEQFWIAYMMFLGADLTNRTAGGIGTIGHKHTEDTRNRMSKSRMGHVGYMTGRTHTDATKEAIRLGNIGRTSPMKGCTHSEETKEKMRATQSARRATEKQNK